MGISDQPVNLAPLAPEGSPPPPAGTSQSPKGTYVLAKVECSRRPDNTKLQAPGGALTWTESLPGVAETKVCPIVGGCLPWNPCCPGSLESCFLPSFPLPLSLLLPSSLLPSFFCISALGSPRCHVLGIWAYVSLCCKYYRCLVAWGPRREQGQPLP